MSEYSTKVYRAPGGDRLVVESGGVLEIQQGATVTGLTGAAVLEAAGSVLGGVKAAARAPGTDTLECKIGTDDKLYVAPYTLPAASTAALGGVKAAANQTALGEEADIDDIRAAYIALIAALKTAGIMVADEG